MMSRNRGFDTMIPAAPKVPKIITVFKHYISFTLFKHSFNLSLNVNKPKE